jgi:hypothetical protein
MRNRENKKMKTRLGGVFLLTVCAALGWPEEALAHPSSGIEIAGAAIAEGVFGGPVAIGGLITGLHNGAVSASGGKVTTAWRTTGYVFGGLNIATSVAWVAFAAGVGNSDARVIGLGLSLMHVTVGALGVGLTSMSSAAEPKQGAAVALLPIALRDHRGHFAPGAGLFVSHF